MVMIRTHMTTMGRIHSDNKTVLVKGRQMECSLL
jgi:hypothetical protein